MGYILPLVPLLSMQDSTIQKATQKRYSHIDAIQYVNKQSSFEKEVTRRIDNYYPIKNEKKFTSSSSVPPQREYLAKEIAEVTGKGRIINHYI